MTKANRGTTAENGGRRKKGRGKNGKRKAIKQNLRHSSLCDIIEYRSQKQYGNVNSS